MGLFTPGTPRIALLDGSGNKLKTLYLPEPDRQNGVNLEWVEKASYTDLVDGSESCRRLGWIPVLTLSWAAYNEVFSITGRTIGGADGNQADLLSLLALLDADPRRLKVSPGPSAGGFVAGRVTVSGMGVVGGIGIATGLKITIRGGPICSSKVLGAW